MEAELSFLQHTQNARINHEDYADLYERAREATKEAQRQGDAQLKAAMAAATAVPINTVCICPLSLTFSNTGLEKVYWEKSSMNSDKKDVCTTMFQFLLRTALLCLLLRTCGSQRGAETQGQSGSVYSVHAMTISISYLWVTAFCAAMMMMRSRRCLTWSQGNRGIILLLASSLLCCGELMAVSASCKHPTLDLAYVLSQCLLSNTLHRVPLCLHIKMRLFGYGLQTFGTLAMAGRVHEAVPLILYFGLSHFLGVAFAYFSDHRSRVGFLKSRFDVGKRARDSQIYSQQVPKRALGGFAGGFAGVSGLRCAYPPSIWTVISSNYGSSSMEGYASEVSRSSSSTVEDSISGISSGRKHIQHVSSSKKDPDWASDVICSARSGLDRYVYWRFGAATRASMDD